MDNHKLQIIFPKDETTDFLQEIITYITSVTPVDAIVHRLTSVEDHLQFRDKADNLLPLDTPVLFMGHGVSNALSGATIGSFSYGPFIQNNELSLFKNRRIICLSCRSNEYLRAYGRGAGLIGGIGFPNMITDIYETYYPEGEEAERIQGINAPEIEKFKTMIVNIVKYSLEDFIIGRLSFYQLYKRIQIRSQRALMDFYSANPNQGKLPYGKMLHDLSEGVNLIGN